ncbi:hypothetical protein HAX54_015562, partial [Datura stramonium]|nr:hypothetical protein [Datura stramonium]
MKKIFPIGISYSGGNLTEGCSGDNLVATISLVLIREVDEKYRQDMTEFVNYEIEYESDERSREATKNDDYAITKNILYREVVEDQIYMNKKTIGWEYCKAIMVVDGSFFKATYWGTISTSCTLDAA